MVAADACPMGIEWAETAVWSVGETVRESMVEDVGSRRLRDSIVAARLGKLGEEFCCVLRRRETERASTRKRFELERVASCGRSEQRR